MYLFSDDILRNSSSFDVPHVIVLQSTRVDAPVEDITKQVEDGIVEAEALILDSKHAPLSLQSDCRLSSFTSVFWKIVCAHLLWTLLVDCPLSLTFADILYIQLDSL